MITPEEFPYITGLHVNDCYTYKDFDIKLHDYKPFSHLVLTGNNGSGKSTILKGINEYISAIRSGSSKLSISNKIKKYNIDYLDSSKRKNYALKQEQTSQDNKLRLLATLTPEFGNEWFNGYHREYFLAVYSYLQAKRDSKVISVKSPTTNDKFIDFFKGKNSSNMISQDFKQYIVNQKVNQAFSQIDKNFRELDTVNDFFKNFEDILRLIFDDRNIELVFLQKKYDFQIRLSNGNLVSFDVLSEGYSSLISIFMDLLIRIDVIRNERENFSYVPCGIVLIDEPEVHLHLQLQEQILPLLVKFFPNIQFIIATHSPAVIASIKNATIFDLTTKETRTSEDVVGRGYSELMVSHFGINNEYSAIADDIFKKVKDALRNYKDQPERRNEIIQQVIIENEPLLSPTFRVELESILLEHV